MEGAGALKFRRRDWVDDGRFQCFCLGKTGQMFKKNEAFQNNTYMAS